MAEDRDEDAAQKHRERMAKRSRDNFAGVAEIGEIQPVADPERRARCKDDPHRFLVEYFPNTTGLRPFSEDHKRVIARLKMAAQKGGRFFNLVYRGFAKTTISVNVCLWAILYGWRKMVVLIGANKTAAKDLLDAIKAELETNELLAADFPEVIQAIKALEGKNQRCASQTCQGVQTHIEWTKEYIVLPSIEGSESSGATIVTRGITSSIRGLGHRRVDGTQQRPDLVICDDLQTDASAASPAQVKKRLDTLSKTVLKLAGHNNTIACVVNGTIIQPDDLMDRLRDPMQYPGWQGETVKMMKTPADAHETHWLGEYARLRKSFDPTMPGDQERAHAEANKYYRANRAAMDAGCVVSWEHCYDHELEQSAIQHAYNFLIDDGESVFAAECQSEPLKAADEQVQLELGDVIKKLSGLKRREVPAGAVRLTAFIDTQDESFWYVVVAWLPDFTGYVIDYGVFPDQKTSDCSKRKLRHTLTKRYPELKNREARWRAGLNDLCQHLFDASWLDRQGLAYEIGYAFVDVADGDAALSIRTWVAGSKFNKKLHCSMGVGLRPADEPFGERKKTDDELRRGLGWMQRRDKRVRGGSITRIDTNYWKTFAANRWRAGSPRVESDLKAVPHEPGALYLWGTNPYEHTTFGNHQMSETVTRMTHEKSGRVIDFWTLKSSKPDNEFLDGVVGCCAAAHASGGVELRDAGLIAAGGQRKGRSKDDLRRLAEKKRNGR